MLNLWIVLLALTANAKVLQGEVNISKAGDYYINLDNDNSEARIPVFTTNTTTANDVRKLIAGDNVLGQGFVKNGQATFEAIDFVKLQNLVGVWENKEAGVTMDVESLTRVSFSVGKGYKKQAGSFVYALAPNDKTKWTMFILPADPKAKITPAVITYNNPDASRMLKLVVYDPDTRHVQLQTTLFLKK